MLYYMIDSNSLSFLYLTMVLTDFQWHPDRGFQPRADGGAVRELQPDVPW